MDVRTDYPRHDHAYRERRGNREYPGWNTAEDYELSSAIVREVMAWPELPKSGRLLELGCGAANHLAYLSESFEIAGIDVSPTAIEWGIENLKTAGVGEPDLRVGDVRELPWEDGGFDVVRDGHLMHCIIGDDRSKVLAEARRVLKSGGIFLLSSMCGDNGLPEDQWDPETRLCVYGDIATRYVGLPDDLESEVGAAGFDVLRAKVFEDPLDRTDELVVVARKPE